MDLTLNRFLGTRNCSFTYRGSEEKLHQKISGVSIDSRTIQPNEVYFALRGENHDGHDFVLSAFKRQAKAAVVEAKWWVKNKLGFESYPIFVVDDSLKALQESANEYRSKFNIPVLGLTGTNGKTTTKEMVAAVLSEAGKVCKNEGNLNNHIGVPLTLFKLNDSHKILVIEMGMNHFGEIARLCEIAQPDFGLITNIGRGHLEFLKTLEGVAKAKMELFEYLSPNGTPFINLDDPLIIKHAQKFKKSMTYGFSKKANVTGEMPGTNEHGFPVMQVDGVEIKINFLGNHNLINALAAIAVGTEFGIELSQMKSALQNVKLPGKRMEVLKHKKMLILNDAYNANPDSTLAALETLHSIPASGRKIFIFADMLELGELALSEHAKIGESLKNYGIDVFFAFGQLAAEAVLAAKKSGENLIAKHFEDKEALIGELSELPRESETILVKGSQGMKMEEVVEALLEK